MIKIAPIPPESLIHHALLDRVISHLDRRSEGAYPERRLGALAVGTRLRYGHLTMCKPHGDRIVVLALFLVGSMATAAHARAEDLRCAGTNIVAGSPVRQVLDRCGRPAFVERRATLRTQLLESSDGEPRIAYREEALEVWAYRSDKGALQMVTIRKGQVAEIKTIAVVGPSITDDSQSCTPGKLYRGASTAEIFLACGQPNDRQRMVTTTTKRVDDVEYRELVTVERWTYASRRERLRQVLEFENGELRVVTAG